jgi:hypothetical protein
MNLPKLFAELYLDEDMSALVATLLATRGFGVLTARDAGMLGQDDLADDTAEPADATL